MKGVVSFFLSLFFCTSAMALDEMPVSKELGPMEKPAARSPGYTWEAIDEDGDTYISELLSFEEGEAKWKDSDGCTWKAPHQGFAPSTSWSNCPGGAEKGSQNIYESKGNPWPLSDDTKFSYKVTGVAGGYSWRTTRKCEVVDQVRVQVPAGEFDTYKVACEDKWNKRTWWVSPELGKAVAYKRWHKKDKKRRHTYRLVTTNP